MELFVPYWHVLARTGTYLFVDEEEEEKLEIEGNEALSNFAKV